MGDCFFFGRRARKLGQNYIYVGNLINKEKNNETQEFQEVDSVAIDNGDGLGYTYSNGGIGSAWSGAINLSNNSAVFAGTVFVNT